MLRQSLKSSGGVRSRRGGGGPKRHHSIHVAHQPAHFQMADGGRHTESELLAEGAYKRLFKDHGMFDPAIDPQFEIFQVERFWGELDAQLKAWDEAVRIMDAVRAGETVDGATPKTIDQAVFEVHLLGDKLFKFFTFMRAHLDRNPRDRMGFYETRPRHLDDVFGRLLQVLARQIDTDYCPRCHLRLDGSTSVCGDPTVVSKYHYGDNPVFGFEAAEMEHSFWSASWFAEYERRAKALWYQSLQLPFFRTAAHTATQCEGLMDVYKATLNRAEANHFIHQCQVHGLPVTERMVEAHKHIIGNTNPHRVFYHGDPEAVSPRTLRYNIELEKLDEFTDEHGLLKYPPASYLPHMRADEMYEEIPNTFETDERNWVSNYQEVTSKVQETVDGWSPSLAQRSQSSEFPDWAYDEATLSMIQHYRTEVARAKLKTKATPFKVRNKSVARSSVPGLFSSKNDDVMEKKESSVVFPTAYGYEQFDTSEEAFASLYHWPSEGDGEMLKFSIKPGARLRAVSLQHLITPHQPGVTHRFPINVEDRKDLTEEEVAKLPVVEFTNASRAMYEKLAYATHANPNESIEEWRRRGGRPWCEGKWEDVERGERKFSKSKDAGGLRIGTNYYVLKEGDRSGRGRADGSLLLVGEYNGELWAARNNERFASVVLGSTLDDLKKYSKMPGDMWAVQENIEVEGIVVGVKDEQIWVQWGPNAVATPIGSTMESIEKSFRNLQVLSGTTPLVEPPSWCIPFRNNWAEEGLRKALRAPWDAQELTPRAPHQMPTLALDPADTAAYRLDDFRTKEYEQRVQARNLLGGSTRLAGDRRYNDDAVFSVNVQGDNAMHTGYGQPQVDRDEVRMPMGVEDGTRDEVPEHEIEDMEQALRDISGRAPGAVDPDVGTLAPDAAVNDPMQVRRHSQLAMAQRTTLVTNPSHPTYKEIDTIDQGQLAQKQQIDQTESWEFGGWKAPGQMQVLPHQRAMMTGKDPKDAPHTRLHMTGKEAEYLKIPQQYRHVVETFNAMNEFYSEMNKPYDVGHNELPFGPNVDPLRPRDAVKKSMAVGTKRRMAGLLLRLWMKKAERTGTTLRDFAKEYKLHRLALLSWFGGDSPASPSLLRALKHWLRAELDELDLLDDFKIEDVDTYSPVYEPGFYKWLDKSRFEHQHEMLLAAKLERYSSVNNIALRDPLSARKEVTGEDLDSSQRQELKDYERKLMAGNTDPMSRDSLTQYDVQTKATLPRAQVVLGQNKGGARLTDYKENIGIEKDNVKDAKTFGLLSLSDLRNAIYQTELFDIQARFAKQIYEDERKRVEALDKQNIMDARACIQFTKDWDEGLSMDILYALRRNMGNDAMRAAFEDFMQLDEEASALTAKLDGLYEHKDGAFRVKDMHVENATHLDDEWEGTLESTGENVWEAPLTNGQRLRVRRLNADSVEWSIADDANDAGMPRVATAKRADLDLKGALWRLYVKGDWVPGKDEVSALVYEWTKRNVDQVKWELVTDGLKSPDVAFIQAALDAGIALEEGPLAIDGDKRITRRVRASGSLADVDSWVNNIPYPGLQADQAAVLKVDSKERTFSFECDLIAADVAASADHKAQPFEFDSFRTELTAAKQKWASLGMGLKDDTVAVMARKGVPQYGVLVELLHWLDVILARIEVDMEDIVAEYNEKVEDNEQITVQQVFDNPNQPHLQEVATKFEEYKQIQIECMGQVWEYQRAADEAVGPILLGNAGYNGSLMNADGELHLMYGTEDIGGFMAKVINRQLPLLNWWRGMLDVVRARKDRHRMLLARAVNA